MAKRLRARATRLPSGSYAWRGRAVSFSRLPQAERHRLRSVWSRRATVTLRRRSSVGVIKVTERPPLPGDRRKGLRFFGANVPRDASIGDARRIVDAVRRHVEAVRLHAEKASRPKRGSWVCTIEWPDDPRTRRGKPHATVASRKYRDIATVKGRDQATSNAKDYFSEVMEAPEILSGEKSRGVGRAVLTSIQWMVFEGVKNDGAG